VELEPVVAWIDAYLDAWRSNDVIRIGALFTEDATYAYHPWDDPLRGRDAIVEDWLKEPDEPGTWEAHYRPLFVEGDRAIVTGETRYVDGETYSNLFVVDFDGNGRCRAFTEWYMLQPDRSTQGGTGSKGF
jgi:ketosteroid isomerase-like protein